MLFGSSILKETHYLKNIKVAMSPEIGQVKIFYHSPVRIVECVSELYIFNYKKQHTHTRTHTHTHTHTHKIKTRRQKTKETKEEKRISAEKLRGYEDIICQFALCTFNFINRIVNFSWFFM